jgi:hypothetical protein
MGGSIINIAIGIVSMVGVATGNLTLVCSGPAFAIAGAVLTGRGIYQLWQLRRRQASDNSRGPMGAPILNIAIGFLLIFDAATGAIACHGPVFAVGGAVLTGLGILGIWHLRRLRRRQTADGHPA